MSATGWILLQLPLNEPSNNHMMNDSYFQESPRGFKKKKKKAFGKNLLSDQMTEMSENVFCRKRISVLRGF